MCGKLAGGCAVTAGVGGTGPDAVEPSAVGYYLLIADLLVRPVERGADFLSVNCGGSVKLVLMLFEC